MKKDLLPLGGTAGPGIPLRVQGRRKLRMPIRSLVCSVPQKCFIAGLGRMIHGFALALAMTVSAQAAGDPQKGQQVFNAQCKACHTLEAGKHGIGPSLHGVIGRKAGSLPDYNYSPAMKKADVTWNEDTLKNYLTDPHKLIPGDKMAFAGIKNESQLDDLIAYLKQATQ
jgi:cytochrome c2